MKKGGRVSLLDVAAAAGVSKSTASRALLDQSGTSEAIRKHVQQVATDLGYVKDFGAHALKAGATQTIGVFVRSVQLSFYGELITEIQKTVEEAGYRLAVTTASPHSEGLVGLDSIMGLRPEGLIVASGRVSQPALESAASMIPVVVAGPATRSAVVGSVSDDGKGIAALARLVVEAGHQRIAVINVSKTRSTTLGARSQKLRKELTALGVTPVQIAVSHELDAPDPVALKRAIGSVTAIMCPNDPILVHTWEMLRDWDVDVPGDVSLTGYDGVGQLASPVFGLTTWRQPVAGMGRAAALQVLERIHDRRLPPKNVRLSGELIPGRTLGKHG